jgi:hypothetical protein
MVDAYLGCSIGVVKVVVTYEFWCNESVYVSW